MTTLTADLRLRLRAQADAARREQLGLVARHGNVDPDGQIIDRLDERLLARLRSAIGPFVSRTLSGEKQLELALVALHEPERFARMARRNRGRR